jgi:5-formyltetrahydrofolate cyclo-ligase
MPEKRDIRTNSLQIRNSLSAETREQKSLEISKKLEGLDVFQNADNILFYYTHGSEVDTVPLINKWLGKKKIYLPKLKSENEFIALPFHNFDALKKGIYGIPEPFEHKDEKSGHEKKLDLIIVPGAAFDRSCNRLGMGKGFYDRYLNGLKGIPKAALAFEEQILDEVPKEKYDEPVDFIITDQNIYRSAV